MTAENRQTVADLAAFGIPHEHIARHIGVSAPTLTAYYSADLENGLHDTTAKVAGVLVKAALKGNVGACIFWLKTRARWTVATEANTPDAPAPTTSEPLLNYEELSTPALRELLALVDAKAKDGAAPH